MFHILPLTGALSRWEIRLESLQTEGGIEQNWMVNSPYLNCALSATAKSELAQLYCIRSLLLFVCDHCALRVFAEVMPCRAWHIRIGKREVLSWMWTMTVLGNCGVGFL